MNKDKLIQTTAISVIIITTIIAGYILLGPRRAPSTSGQDKEVLAPLVNGKQVINMTVFSVSYNPSSFTVKAKIPVVWEITASGQPGCASGVIVSNVLPSGSVYLNPNQGEMTVAEFTPQVAGTYRFSCPMNMARGTINVIN